MLDFEILSAALVGYEHQVAELNARIQEIRRALRATEDAPAVIPVAVVPVTRQPRRKKRVISAEGRRNIIEATKKRWARYRREQEKLKKAA
jgi:hypothetical protein